MALHSFVCITRAQVFIRNPVTLFSMEELRERKLQDLVRLWFYFPDDIALSCCL